MFDISWGELVLVGVVALIVIGPKELPTVLRTVGQWMTKMRRMAAEFQSQFHEAMREAEFADLKQQIESIADPKTALSGLNPLDDVQKEIDGAQKQMEQALADTPTATPSGEPNVVSEKDAGTSRGEPPSEPAADNSASPSAVADPSPATEPTAEGAGALPAHPEPAGVKPAAEPANPSAAGGRAA